MESTNTQDSHVHGAIAGIVMLAAIITTYSTYSAYQDVKLASNYEEDQVNMDQTASAFVALRIHRAEFASTTASTTATTTKKIGDKKPEPKKIEKKVELKSN